VFDYWIASTSSVWTAALPSIPRNHRRSGDMQRGSLLPEPSLSRGGVRIVSWIFKAPCGKAKAPFSTHLRGWCGRNYGDFGMLYYGFYHIFRFRVCDKKSVAQSESVENCWETLVCSSKIYIIIYIYLFSKYDCHWNIPIRTWLDTWMWFRICRYIWI